MVPHPLQGFRGAGVLRASSLVEALEREFNIQRREVPVCFRHKAPIFRAA